MLRTETVRIICDRGVTHEIVRQRKCSFTQKSTRYCDEKGEIEFIEPCWDYSVPEDFCNTMSGIENVYKNLRRHGWKPEQARSVLPNSVTTEIVVKATVQQWKHIFKLRCAKGAHPQMREIMIPLEEEFKKRKII
jgi:thymidylate synthase (FAD)